MHWLISLHFVKRRFSPELLNLFLKTSWFTNSSNILSRLYWQQPWWHWKKLKNFSGFLFCLCRWKRPISELTQTGSGATRTGGNRCRTAGGCRRSRGREACQRALVRLHTVKCTDYHWALAHPSRRTKTALASKTLFVWFTPCHDSTCIL